MSAAQAAPLPGGTLDPTTIPKYVIPLVIPPEMPKSAPGSAYDQGATADYNIAMREFPQQILPGGVWTTLTPANPAGIPVPMPATPVFSYGRAEDPTPAIAPEQATISSFNYPAFTIEAMADTPDTVRWVNELVAPGADGYPCGSPLSTTGCAATFLPHVVTGSVDQSLHWANPNLSACQDGTARTDCRPDPNINVNPTLGQPYTGPVPMITHVHGAHVNPDSDGYPEAWWLPAASDITPCTGVITLPYPADPAAPAGTPTTYEQPVPAGCYVPKGAQYGEALPVGTNLTPGSAYFSYRNDQAPTTLWYHDHTLGMTRSNVYAGPAGFWLVRGTWTDPVSGATVPDAPATGILPGAGAGGRPTDPTATGCDPNFDAVCRAAIREIPVVIQDRSFNIDGTLFYALNRNFFNFIRPNATVPYVPYDPTTCVPLLTCSDIAPIWNPEFFGNTMVVNGTTWPDLQVQPQRYRLRLLDGADARFLNLSLRIVPPTCDKKTGVCVPDAKAYTLDADTLQQKKYPEMPIYQIGAEQGFLPKVVEITTGFATKLPGTGTIPAIKTPAASPDQALLVAPAERADVILDFTGLQPGTVVRMINTGPDAPFGGFPAAPIADAGTTGQIMSFTVAAATGTDPSTPVASLVLPTDIPIGPPSYTRGVSLNEAQSEQICVKANAINGQVKSVVYTYAYPNPGIAAACAALNAVPFAPKEALLGTMPGGVPTPQLWADPITQNPSLGTTEDWEMYNYTVDAHPIHVHLVRFKVIDRQPLAIDPLTGMPQIPAARDPLIPARPAELTEEGYKDTVIAYPGEVTRVRALFDIQGLYVWHCHILEHEDNEMMVPFCVGAADSAGNCSGSTVPISTAATP